MLDRIMTEGHTKLSYDELKSAAQDRLKWRHRYQDLPTQAENEEKWCFIVSSIKFNLRDDDDDDDDERMNRGISPKTARTRNT